MKTQKSKNLKNFTIYHYAIIENETKDHLGKIAMKSTRKHSGGDKHHKQSLRELINEKFDQLSSRLDNVEQNQQIMRNDIENIKDVLKHNNLK